MAGNKKYKRGASTRFEAVKPVSFQIPKGIIVAVVVCLIGSVAVYSFPFVTRIVDEKRVEHITIEGNLDYLPEQVIEQVVLNFIDENILKIRLEEIKNELELNPWIESANLRREWPESLVINVKEAVPIAKWGDAGILSTNGVVFYPENWREMSTLPVLEGPNGKEKIVMQQYQAFNQVLYQYGLKISQLELSERGAWEMKLEGGIEIKVGKGNLMEKFSRFISFVEKLDNGSLASIRSIDLRYSNGVAVGTFSDLSEEVAAR